MLDLHCHILPGVDDGAVDLADTCSMAREALATGCRAVCASSHLGEGLFFATPELLRIEHANTVRELERAGIALEVFPAAENYLGEGSAAEFAENAVPVGTAGRYVLFDFSLRAVPPHLPDALAALRARERIGVIAHPERNREIQADLRPVAEWIEQGALIQVNAGSVLGWLGSEAQSAAQRLLEAGAVHVLASDAHGRRRPFCLDQGREAASALVGADEAERLTSERPWRIVRGEDIEVGPVAAEALGEGRGRWRRLWGG